MSYSEPIWKAWFAKHGGKLLLFARQQARYPDDAEDLVQEAFVRIWRLYGHTGEVSPSLVYRAIRRLAIDWAEVWTEGKFVSKKAFRISISALRETSRKMSEIRHYFEQLINYLKNRILTLKIWGELTFDQIAKTLNISLNTVASRYRYALQN